MIGTDTVSGTVTGNSIPATVSARARTSARTVALLLGLTAVIVGILGMHVWMGAHNTVGHGSHPAVTAAAPAALTPAGHQDPAPGVQAMTAGTETGPAAAHCAGPCGDSQMAAGMCVLALMVVSIAGLLGLKPGLLASAAGLRGPPRILPRALVFLQPPSLVQLSISRT
jgi:hypothetical protein